VWFVGHSGSEWCGSLGFSRDVVLGTRTHTRVQLKYKFEVLVLVLEPRVLVLVLIVNVLVYYTTLLIGSAL